MRAIIETKNLTKIFGRGKEKVVAVNNLSLKIPYKSITGLIGHNGAGKTTLISMLVGLILPTRGNGTVLGYDIVKESREIRRKVGLLPEGFGFYDNLTAYQNLEYLAELNDIQDKYIEESLKIVRLEKYKDYKVSTFSRGMRQRLGIAQALLKNPEVLILDEPTIGIDPAGSLEFKDLLKRLIEQGRSIIISTHLLHELGDICNYLVIIRQGKLLAQGRKDDIVQKYIEEIGNNYYIKLRGGDTLVFKKIEDQNSKVNIKDNIIKITSKRDLTDVINSIFKEREIVVEEFIVNKPSVEDLYMFYYKRGGVHE